MLSAIKQRLEREEDEGFTLIELMVVVLIIAILLAIAIPTFLGARNSANSRAAQSNLRNALTAEQTQWTNSQQFSADVSTTGMPSIESGINWTTGTAGTSTPNQVSVTTGDSGAEVLLQAQGNDKNCYYVVQSNDSTQSYTGYAEESGPCTAVTAVPTLAAPTADSVGKHIATAGTVPGTFYTSF